MIKQILKIGFLLNLAAQLCGQVLILDYRDGERDSLRLDEIAYFYIADSSAEVVRLASPLNGESKVQLDPVFHWREVSGQSYELLLSRSESFTDTVYYVSGLESGSWTPPEALEIGTRYFWKVRITGKSLWTAAWHFSTWAPEIPEKISAMALLQGDQSGSIRIAALLPLMVEELLVVSGFDGQSFPDTLQCDSSGSVISGLEPDSCYYIRIAAVNAAGIGPFSELLAIRPSRDALPVLIVNGFDRATAGNSYNFVRQHASAVRNSGRIPVSASNEALTEGLVSPDDHAAVIWILGEESTVDETFSDAEQNRVKSYLQNGGRLFVSGAEIAWDLDYKGSSSDKAFCHDFLRLCYVQDSPNNAVGTYYGVEASGPEIFAELGSFSFDNGTQGSYDVRYPDVLGVSGDSQGFLKYTGCNTGFAGIVYEGMFPDGNTAGKVMVLGFPFETVYPESRRDALMESFFRFTEEGLAIGDAGDVPQIFLLETNYPNPFNPATKIRYRLPSRAEINVTIFDMNGKEVRTLVSRTQEAGYYTQEWNAEGFASGLYVCVLYVNHTFVASNKMLFIK
ncbi:MAG: T9SS type A sorting domain-containing protein [Candidatus Neomarinimicrobiota bacterium]|jgi:hypothetical protein|nr:T9SS type A sorting domain-containing protein [Candidatus Neomarinimicrobiota bacterium]